MVNDDHNYSNYKNDFTELQEYKIEATVNKNFIYWISDISY
jgi:hypothetical protein